MTPTIRARVRLVTLLVCVAWGAKARVFDYQDFNQDRFREAAEQVLAQLPDALAEFKAAAESFVSERIVPVPRTPALSHAGRYRAADVRAFAVSYRSALDTSGAGHQTAIAGIHEQMLQVRIRSIVKLAGLPDDSVRVVVQGLEPNAFKVRPSAANASTYLIIVGTEFLKRLDETLLRHTALLQQTFVRAHTGLLTEGLTIDQFVSPSAFVDRAPQMHPQNLISHATRLAGGGSRSPLELFMVQLALSPLLRSKAIPDDIRQTIMTLPSGVVTGSYKLPSLADAEAVYREGSEHFQGLHYYQLRDVVTYLAAHEIAHIKLNHLSDGGKTLPLEVAADTTAVGWLQNLGDTDPRSLLTAVAAFVAELRAQSVIDTDHPMGPQRIRTMAHALEAVDEALLLDLDAGLRLVPQAMPNASCPDATFVHSLDQAILVRCVRSTSAKPSAEFDDLELPLAIQIDLIDPVDPSQARATAVFQGLLKAPSISSVLSPTGASLVTYEARLDLPPVFWTTCEACAVAVRPSASGARDGWSGLSDRPRLDMVRTLSSLPRVRRSVSMMALARFYYDRGAMEDTQATYQSAAAEDDSILSAGDWVRWVLATPDSDWKARAGLLLRARQRHAQTVALGYLSGLAHEMAGSPLPALDGYFHEQYGVSNSTKVESATRRLIALFARFSGDKVLSQFSTAFGLYLTAQNEQNTGRSREALDKFATASKAFANIRQSQGSFAAAVYENETAMYAARLRGAPMDDVLRGWTEFVKQYPDFTPAYVHLFGVEYCRRNIAAANEWLFTTLRRNLLGVNKMLMNALSTLDHPWRAEACAR